MLVVDLCPSAQGTRKATDLMVTFVKRHSGRQCGGYASVSQIFLLIFLGLILHNEVCGGHLSQLKALM